MSASGRPNRRRSSTTASPKSFSRCPAFATREAMRSKVRALAKKKGFRFSGEAVDALSKLVETAVSAAGARAKANKRQTIKVHCRGD